PRLYGLRPPPVPAGRRPPCWLSGTFESRRRRRNRTTPEPAPWKGTQSRPGRLTMPRRAEHRVHRERCTDPNTEPVLPQCDASTRPLRRRTGSHGSALLHQPAFHSLLVTTAGRRSATIVNDGSREKHRNLPRSRSFASKSFL